MSDSYSLEIKTVQSAAFRVLTEALKEILTDANFEIDSTGIKVMALDSSHTVLVHLKLSAGNFEYYKCDEKKILGINMLNFFQTYQNYGKFRYINFIFRNEENEKCSGYQDRKQRKKHNH